MKNKVAFLGFIFLVVIFLPTTFVFAQNNNSNSDTQTLIKQLQEQIKALEAQIIGLKAQLEATQIELKFTKTLIRGMTGKDVEELQSFLKQFPDIYPEGLVTGYFGSLTENAVKKWQEQQGIDSVGIVGPKTRAKLNEVVISGGGGGGSTSAIPATPSQGNGTPATPATPATPSSGNSGSPVTPATPATPATPSSSGGTPTTPATPATPATPSGNGGNGTTPTDTTPPVISNIQATNITETTATITWTTNELASSEVWYAASSTVHWYTATGTIAIKMTGTDNVTSHGVNLSSLTTSKTYYYVAISKDAAGNTATSSEQTFTTLTPPPPVSSWSNIQITNFSGNGNLYYGQQPAIAWNGNNYGVAWVGNDGIPGTQNIFFKKLDINGNPVGDHIKITDYVSSGAATAFAPNIIWNGSEYGIAWTANKGNGQNLYFATLDANGNTLTNIVLSVPNDNTTDARPGLKWTGASFAITWRGYDPYNMSITYRFYAEVATDGQALAVSKKIATDNEWNSVNINIFSGTVLSSGGKIYFSDTNVSQELVSTVAGSNSWPFITWNGVKYAIAWINVQNNQTQLYFGTK